MIKTVSTLETREMELAGLMREMISLGWTPESFDADFDAFDSDEVSADEKETCRKVFDYVWDEVIADAPYTCVLRSSDLSEPHLHNIVLGWYRDTPDEQIEEVKEAIVSYVNNHLPEYMTWSLETSEIMGKAGQKITPEEFNDLLEKAFDEFLV